MAERFSSGDTYKRYPQQAEGSNQAVDLDPAHHKGTERGSSNDIKSKAEKARRKSALKNRPTFGQKAGRIAASTALAAATIAGAAELVVNSQSLPEHRQTPERSAPQVPGMSRSEIQAKKSEDEKIRQEELARVRKALKPENEIPPAPDKTGEQTKGFE